MGTENKVAEFANESRERRCVGAQVQREARETSQEEAREQTGRAARTARMMRPAVSSVPVVVGFVPLSEDVDCEALRSSITESCCLDASGDHPVVREVVLPGPKKTRWSLLPVLRSTEDPLEMVKLFIAVELVILVANGDRNGESIDEAGHSTLRLFKKLGVTSHVVAVQCSVVKNMKETSAVKKRVLTDVSSHVGRMSSGLSDSLCQMGEGVKAFVVNTEDQCRSMLQHLQPNAATVPHWRRQRPSVCVQDCRVLQSDDGRCSVSLRGYVRHAPLSANQVVALPGFEGFAVERISVEDSNKRNSEGSCQTVVLPDAELQESLSRENAFVPEEEMPPVEERVDDPVQRTTRRVPKGTSDYQAAWIPDDGSATDTENEAEMEELGSQLSEDVDDFREARSVGPGDAMSVESDGDNVSWGGMEMDTDVRDEEDRKRHPDEVKTSLDRPARVRFQRYRGLKSFRTSPWDAKADLPPAYSRIFEFDSFAHAAKTANKANEPTIRNAVPQNAFVCLVLKDIAEATARRMAEDVARFRRREAGPLTAFGLKQHEAKMSVLHYRVTKASEHGDPVVGKEKFLLVSGFRWFEAAPLFSTDDTRYDKHKMELSLETGYHSIASVYGQILFPPMPLLAFKRQGEGHPRLAFSGTLLSCAPDRVILKRIVLAGRIHKAYKKRAVVGGMFHDPEDVRWFKPLELWTKGGRTGYVKESLGTKGLMKCTFDGNVKHHDTVCISLYKRVFPVWPKD